MLRSTFIFLALVSLFVPKCISRGVYSVYPPVSAEEPTATEEPTTTEETTTTEQEEEEQCPADGRFPNTEIFCLNEVTQTLVPQLTSFYCQRLKSIYILET